MSDSALELTITPLNNGPTAGAKKMRTNEGKPKKVPAAAAKAKADGETRKRKVKKPKDPLAPKKALSAFFWFSKEARTQVMADNPGMKITDVTKKLGEKWKSLTAEEKKPFDEKAKVDKARYTEEMKIYKK